MGIFNRISRNQEPKADGSRSNDPKDWLRMLYRVLVAGFVPIFIFAVPLSRSHLGNTLNILGVALLTAVGAAFAGILLGLLFGIPVERQAPSPEGQGGQDGSKAAAATGGTQTGTSPLRQSNKLQEIADWLTKIIIGLGLIELAKIPDKIKGLAAYIGQGLGASTGSEAFALGILGFYFIGGFCFGYLWADLVFPGMLRDVYYTLTARVDDLQKQVKGLIDKDADALRLAELWLSQPADDRKGEQELKDAIMVASPTARHLVFNQAYGLETPALTREQRMRRRLPVFEALVEEDKERKAFHRNRGQLGVALATCDRNDGQDLGRAVEMLTEAIQRRPQIPGRRNYEFYRAYARILQNSSAKDDIRQDLTTAWENDPLLRNRVEEKHGSPSLEKESRDEYTEADIEKITRWLQPNDKDLYDAWIQAAQKAAHARLSSTPQPISTSGQTASTVAPPAQTTSTAAELSPAGTSRGGDAWSG